MQYKHPLLKLAIDIVCQRLYKPLYKARYKQRKWIECQVESCGNCTHAETRAMKYWVYFVTGCVEKQQIAFTLSSESTTGCL